MCSCRDIQLDLAEYASGELSPADRDTVAAHVAGCGDCAAELERERQLRRLLGDLPVAACPAPIVAPGPNGLRPAGRRNWLTAGVAVALAASLVAMVLVRTPQLLNSPEGSERAVIDREGRSWSRTEIDNAREQLRWSLALTARVIDRTEKQTVIQVFGKKLPRAINQSLKGAANATQGGKG